MKLSEMKLYICNNYFKHAIVTPKVTMDRRKALFVEFITDKHIHYFGECNAFETDWYADETIEVVYDQTIKWFEAYKNHEFERFSDVQNALQCLEQYPATRSMIVMACYQAFYELETFNVPYGATVSGLTYKHIFNLKDTQPQRVV